MEAKDFLDSPECKPYKAALLAHFQKIVDAAPDDDELPPKTLKKPRSANSRRVKSVCSASAMEPLGY
jgi:hypothetical protein